MGKNKTPLMGIAPHSHLWYFEAYSHSESHKCESGIFPCCRGFELLPDALSIPEDFLHYSLSAMQHLHKNHHSNVFHNLARSIGRMRPDGTDSRFPVKSTNGFVHGQFLQHSRGKCAFSVDFCCSYCSILTLGSFMPF